MEKTSLDLTKTPPRSVREKLFGVVQIPRTIDKAEALAHGNVGEYNYDCPMDNALFEFLGIDGKALLEVVKTKSEKDVEAYIKPFVDKKSADEIERWNTDWLNHGPDPGSQSEAYFLNMRNELAPDRTDIVMWADLLDLDEKRPVPKRNAA